MTHENPDDITFDRLKDFLCRIGFEQTARIRDSLAFQHRECGTLILLSIPDDGCTVRPADLVSVLVHLGNCQMVDDSTLEQLESGRLPKAS